MHCSVDRAESPVAREHLFLGRAGEGVELQGEGEHVGRGDAFSPLFCRSPAPLPTHQRAHAQRSEAVGGWVKGQNAGLHGDESVVQGDSDDTGVGGKCWPKARKDSSNDAWRQSCPSTQRLAKLDDCHSECIQAFAQGICTVDSPMTSFCSGRYSLFTIGGAWVKGLDPLYPPFFFLLTSTGVSWPREPGGERLMFV
jgi:hypothetical protein